MHNTCPVACAAPLSKRRITNGERADGLTCTGPALGTDTKGQVLGTPVSHPTKQHHHKQSRPLGQIVMLDLSLLATSTTTMSMTKLTSWQTELSLGAGFGRLI